MTTKIYDFMAIKWRLTAVMADREIDNQRLHELTGLHLGTISKLRNNPPSRIDVITLNLLCTALDCQPGELLRFVPDVMDKSKLPIKQNKLIQLKSSEIIDVENSEDTESAA